MSDRYHEDLLIVEEFQEAMHYECMQIVREVQAVYDQAIKCGRSNTEANEEAIDVMLERLEHVSTERDQCRDYVMDHLFIPSDDDLFALGLDK